MSELEEPKSLIGIRTAILLFALLAALALATLKGPALYIALLIVAALAAKAILHHLRSRIE
jgi:hypothetical protein